MRATASPLLFALAACSAPTQGLTPEATPAQHEALEPAAEAPAPQPSVEVSITYCIP